MGNMIKFDTLKIYFDIIFFRDLNQELDSMKQLLKEIVKRITDNLLGKSSSGSENGRQSRLTRDGSGSHSVMIKKMFCSFFFIFN
jgi:hypothetical protein